MNICMYCLLYIGYIHIVYIHSYMYIKYCLELKGTYIYAYVSYAYIHIYTYIKYYLELKGLYFWPLHHGLSTVLGRI